MKVCRFLVLGAALVTAAACSGGERAASDSGAATADSAVVQSIDLVANDYAFQAPDTVAAGPTWIRMTNAGKEIHHVVVVHLEPGHTVEEFLKAAAASPAPPTWAHPLGGPIAPLPGGAATLTAVDLAAGSYALVCFIPGADGVPHVAKGMVRSLTVTAPASAAAATPIAATTTVTLADYSFTPSTPLTAGRNVIRVVNTASQPHELVLVRLLPGKTVGDVAAFGEKPVGEPPGEIVGGASFIAGTGENFIDVDLTPGDYGFICFVPDAKDGKAHVAHGMMQQFKIN